MHTHHDPEYLRVIGFVIAAVKGLFANCECGLDCKRVFVINGRRSKVLINVVHGQYDCGNAGGSS